MTVSLGARILRMETAAIAATAILLYRYGCMRIEDEGLGNPLPTSP